MKKFLVFIALFVSVLLITTNVYAVEENATAAQQVVAETEQAAAQGSELGRIKAKEFELSR